MVNTGATEKAWPVMPQLAVSWGEVFDKWVILQIKTDKLQAAQQRANVMKECQEVEQVIGPWSRFPGELSGLVQALSAVNTQLWAVEDAKRDCERRQCFDGSFVQLARQVYLGNDRRAAIKRQINELLGSALVEEKSYPKQRDEAVQGT